MKFNFKKYLKVFNPDPAVGGLEISDDAVRFILLENDGSVARQAFVPLAANIVHEGNIINDTALAAALYQLRGMAGSLRHETPVVVTVSPSLVYTHIFSLPYLEGDALESAARLNLQMVSPMDADMAYADWQLASDLSSADTGATLEVLGAFADIPVINAYHTALARAGFFAVACEFASLSLARVVRAAPGLDPAGPYCIISAAGDGVIFIILKNGNPYFTKFVSWKEFGGDSLDAFKKVVGFEIRRLLDFYRSRWNGDISAVIVMNVAPNKEIAPWIKTEFSLEVFIISGYQTLDQTWLVVAGAALRGLVPRADDRFISIGPVGTEEQFTRNRVRRFVGFWRATVAVVMVLAITAYFASDIFMIRFASQAKTVTARLGATADGAEAVLLEARVGQFNALTAKALTAVRATPSYTVVLRTLFGASGRGVVISAVQLNSVARSIVVSGTAPTEQGAVAFKVFLADNPAIERIDMPLSTITTVSGGRAAFTATITLK